MALRNSWDRSRGELSAPLSCEQDSPKQFRNGPPLTPSPPRAARNECLSLDIESVVCIWWVLSPLEKASAELDANRHGRKRRKVKHHL